jgi:3-oxoacyl-ACP reductase-like protein
VRILLGNLKFLVTVFITGYEWDIYSSPNIVRVIKSRRKRWAGHVAQMWEERDVYRVLVGKHEVKKPLGRPRHRWEDNIKVDLQEVGCGRLGWLRIETGGRQLCVQ